MEQKLGVVSAQIGVKNRQLIDVGMHRVTEVGGLKVGKKRTTGVL